MLFRIRSIRHAGTKRMEWANYIRRHSFLAHLLFSLSLEHYLPTSMLQAKLHNSTEEVLCPLCLECDYLYKSGAFGYRSVDAAPRGQCCHCAMRSRTCARGGVVMGSISVHPCVVGCRGIRLLPLLWGGRGFPCGDLGWIFETLWHPAISTQLVLGMWNTYCSFCWSSAPSLAPRERCWIAPALGALSHMFGPELSGHGVPACPGRE